MANAPQPRQASTHLANESAAGEEDPGAANEIQPATAGDGSPPGSPGASKAPCAECGGSGRAESGDRCPVCDGVGTVAAAVD